MRCMGRQADRGAWSNIGRMHGSHKLLPSGVHWPRKDVSRSAHEHQEHGIRGMRCDDEEQALTYPQEFQKDQGCQRTCTRAKSVKYVQNAVWDARMPSQGREGQEGRTQTVSLYKYKPGEVVADGEISSIDRTICHAERRYQQSNEVSRYPPTRYNPRVLTVGSLGGQSPAQDCADRRIALMVSHGDMQHDAKDGQRPPALPCALC